MSPDIPDGEIHPLSKDFAYILEFVEGDKQYTEITEIHKKFLLKYCEYIYRVDKEKAIEYIFRHLQMHLYGTTPDEFCFFHRPPWMCSSLAIRGTTAMKFKRLPNDGLESH